MKSRTFRRSTIALASAAVATMISVSGFQTATAQQGAAKVELPPAEFPVSRVGDTRVWRKKNGEDVTVEVTAIDGETLSLLDSEGCSWSTVIGFGPSVEWSGCGGSAGTQTIKKRERQPFVRSVAAPSRSKHRTTFGSVKGKNNLPFQERNLVERTLLVRHPLSATTSREPQTWIVLRTCSSGNRIPARHLSIACPDTKNWSGVEFRNVRGITPQSRRNVCHDPR